MFSPPILMLGLVKHLVFDFLHQIADGFKHRGSFGTLGFQMLCRILLKGRCNGIRISSFEENKILGGLFRVVFLYGKVNTVFSGDTFKRFDVFIAYLDIGNACTLPDKFFDGLLAFARTVFYCRQFLVNRLATS